MDEEEQTFIPESEWPKVVRDARVWLVIYGLVVVAALYLQSWLPLMFIGLPTLYGGWLSYLFGLTQHVGLAEDVLDHRSNCRTIYMGPVMRFMYLNMNYHLFAPHVSDGAVSCAGAASRRDPPRLPTAVHQPVRGLQGNPPDYLEAAQRPDVFHPSPFATARRTCRNRPGGI